MNTIFLTLLGGALLLAACGGPPTPASPDLDLKDGGEPAPTPDPDAGAKPWSRTHVTPP